MYVYVYDMICTICVETLHPNLPGLSTFRTLNLEDSKMDLLTYLGGGSSQK